MSVHKLTATSRGLGGERDLNIPSFLVPQEDEQPLSIDDYVAMIQVGSFI